MKGFFFRTGRRHFSSTQSLNRTALYDFHVAQAGKIVDFAGYALPVQYKAGVKQEHLAVRNACGMFDVSHMGQVDIVGKDREFFVKRLTPVHLDGLCKNQASLSVLMNEDGGILDDTVITRYEDKVSMVLNGACKEKDLKHIERLRQEEFFDKDVQVISHTNKSLIALQGPESMQVLESVLNVSLEKLGFMHSLGESASGTQIACTVTRCGYTGEDGFEVSVNHEDTEGFVKELMHTGLVTPCGLAARDSLRLEAGLCLYGNDLDESRSVVESGLLWVVSKGRRDFSIEENKFLGWERVEREIKEKPTIKRAGLVVPDRKPIRAGVELFLSDGETPAGYVTSGTFSVVLNQPVAMGYITRSLKIGSDLIAKVRGKTINVKVTKMPFVPSNYYRV